MLETGKHRTRPGTWVLLGVLSALLFVAAGASLFVRGFPGILLAGGGACGIGLLGTAARRTRPSPLWAAVLVGSVIGAVASVLIVREVSLQPRHYWNQWALFALPISAVCGSAMASTGIVAALIDRL